MHFPYYEMFQSPGKGLLGCQQGSTLLNVSIIFP